MGRLALIVLAILTALLTAAVIVLVVVLPAEIRQALRDVAVIFLAVVFITIGIAIGVLVWLAWRVTNATRQQVERLGTMAGDVLVSVKETAQATAQTAKTAQGTAAFVSDRTVRPLIEVYSIVAGAARFAQAVFGSRQDRREEDNP